MPVVEGVGVGVFVQKALFISLILQIPVIAFLREKTKSSLKRKIPAGINIGRILKEKILLSKQKYEEAQQLEQNVVQDKQNRMDQLRQLVYPFSIVEIYL